MSDNNRESLFALKLTSPTGDRGWKGIRVGQNRGFLLINILKIVHFELKIKILEDFLNYPDKIICFIYLKILN